MNDLLPTARILAELGMESLPKEEQELFLADIGEVIYEGVMQRVYESLSLGQQDTLVRLMDESAQEPENEEKHAAVMKFIGEQVPELERFITEEVDLLKQAQQEIFEEMTEPAPKSE
jgi:hypothetical protein